MEKLVSSVKLRKSYLLPQKVELGATTDQLDGTVNILMVKAQMKRSAPGERLGVGISAVVQNAMQYLMEDVLSTQVFVVAQQVQGALISFVADIWVCSFLEEYVNDATSFF